MFQLFNAQGVIETFDLGMQVPFQKQYDVSDITVEGCQPGTSDGRVFSASCQVGQASMKKERDYIQMCQKVYMADGNLRCIPFGSYLNTCSNVMLNENGELRAECYDGRSNVPNVVFYQMTNWRGTNLAYVNGALRDA